MKKVKKQGIAKASVRRRCSVAEIVMNNEDLLTQIFLRLPTKSLVKFMLVSKKWLRLIIDPNFAALHTRRNPNFVSSALITGQLELLSISDPKYSGLPKRLSGIMPCLLTTYPPEIQIRQELIIADACNGLLLFRYNIDFSADLYAGYFVGNPTTQSFRHLPLHKCKGFWIQDCLVFDPSKSPHFLVVEVREDRFRRPPLRHVAVYRSELDTWTLMTIEIPKPWEFILRTSSFWNGAIHWISDRGHHILFDPYSNKLIVNKLPVHPRLISAYGIAYMGECDGRFFLIRHREEDEDEDKPGFFVFEMGGDYRSWIATYEVNFRRLAKDVPEFEQDLEFGFHIISIVKGGIREGLLVLVQFYEITASYGLETKKWVVLDDFPNVSTCYPFIESLTPV